MTEDEVRALLVEAIGDRSNYAWCDKHCVSRFRVSEFLTGKRGPTTDILDALGLEYRIMRKQPALPHS